MKCPRCDSREVVPVIFGIPSFDLFERQERGEVILGGCEPRDEEWACRSCRLGWPEGFRVREPKWRAEASTPPIMWTGGKAR